MKKLFTIFLLVWVACTEAQVKIGNNPNTINANSLLELESTDKGFLPPRVALNSTTSVSPLTGTVPTGMLVFSSGGTLTNGYYYWDGSEWKKQGNGSANLVTKTSTTTLLKSETFVLASNDIILTLPVVTSADDGLEITVKNVGIHTDLVKVLGNSGATIDGIADTYLTRYLGQTFVATGGNWVIKEAKKFSEHLLVLDEFESWATLQEAIEFLNLHMFGPSVIRLDDPIYEITSTIDIDLPYPLTIQGLSFGNSTIVAASGLANKPMFRCLSDCNFKMLSFDATTLTNYGTQPGEDAIRFVGSRTYNEIKDCLFDRFYTSILDSTDAELWIFENNIHNAQAYGILIHSAEDSVIIKISETDFKDCKIGICLDKGSKATVQLSSGGFYNSSASDTAICYKPSTFTSFINIHITGNLWNNIGKYIEGFDFARSDGRDANAFIESNAGMGDKNPNCNINVLNNSTSTSTSSTSTWYKANWTNTSASTTKWTIENNKITYQPNNIRNGWITIAGNLASNSSSATVNLGIVKNGSSGTRYGETTLRTSSSGVPYQFSMVVYLTNIVPGDYFELYVNSSQSSTTVTVQDIMWLVNTQ